MLVHCKTWRELDFPLSDSFPIIIPSFNNPTYLTRMIAQLTALRCSNIYVFDNASTFPKMLDCLDKLEHAGITIIRSRKNIGPKFFLNRHFYASLPDIFILTDPDLLLNTEMPENFMHKLYEVSERHKVGKVGFALDISDIKHFRQELFRIDGRDFKIWEWEKQFWQREIGLLDQVDSIYDADIDTTFALYNKRYFDPKKCRVALRVAGRFTCKHLPWYETHGIPEDELSFYKKKQKHSYYFTKTPGFLRQCYEKFKEPL